MTESHVGTGETRRYVVLLRGRSLLRILLLDQVDIGTFASQHRTGKRGLIAAPFRLIGAGVTLIAQRPVLSRQAAHGRTGRAGCAGYQAACADGAVAPGQGKVNAQPVLLALGLPLALVVLVRDDRNRLFRLREEPRSDTMSGRAGLVPDTMSGMSALGGKDRGSENPRGPARATEGTTTG